MDFGEYLNELIQQVKGLFHFVKNEPPRQNTAVQPNKSNSFGQSVLSRAQADLGVHEDLGKNDGKRIREYFKPFGMDAGQDWCAAAVSTWMSGGPIRGGVGARAIGEQFAQANRWVPRKEITSAAMTPGNIVVWARGGPDSWKGHIGVIASYDGNNAFTSI